MKERKNNETQGNREKNEGREEGEAKEREKGWWLEVKGRGNEKREKKGG